MNSSLFFKRHVFMIELGGGEHWRRAERIVKKAENIGAKIVDYNVKSGVCTVIMESSDEAFRSIIRNAEEMGKVRVLM